MIGSAACHCILTMLHGVDPFAATLGRRWKPQRYTDGKFTRFQYQLSDEGPSTIRWAGSGVLATCVKCCAAG